MKKILLSLLLICSNAFAAITDGKFGINQIFDVQYYWSGNTLNASSFIAPYNKNFQTVTASSGQYFQFFASTTNPGKYGLGLYNSNGTLAQVVHDYGDITALGSGAIFYIGSGFFGNVISTAQGYSYGASASFTNMDTSVSSSDLSSYTFASSTPLAAGQTASATPTPNPTNIYSTSTTTVRITNIWPTSYNSPGNEGASNAFDNNPYTKYLNFDKYNAGVTVRWSQGRVATGFTITTANDFPGRDPTSYKLYGSNDGVNWTLIKEGALSLSDSRYTTSGVVNINNSTAYFYYYIQFPTTKAGTGCGLNCDSMQISEITYIYDINNTTSSTDLGGGGSTTPVDPVQAAATPTVVSTSTSNSVSTSSSSSNTNNVTVTNPTTTGNYTNVYVGTTTVTTTTTTPVTTTTWSDGSTTTSTGTPTTTSVTTYTINPTLGIAPTYSRTAPNTAGNSVYIKQASAWANTQVSITQEGNNNAVTGTDSGWATVDGNGSIIGIQQYGQGNITGVKMNAWGNNIDIKQKGASGSDVNDNIFNLESQGNGNAVTLQQQTNTNTASVKMTYDINTVNLTQKGGTGNTSYVTINGYWNTVNETQNGNNNFSLVNISGDNNSATVNQTGNNHSTLLNLIGNKNTVSVTQTGTGDTYSLQQTCTNPAGCSVSVIRNK
jgi:Curlin associated repeat/F5/8 type C domain